MMSVVAMVGVLFAVLAALELLIALHQSLMEGPVLEVKVQRPVSPAYALLMVFAIAGNFLGLIVRELAHAAAQLGFGGRPAVVLLKNGGFARSSPWLPLVPFRIVPALGFGLGGGVIALAPVLVVAVGLAATLADRG